MNHESDDFYALLEESLHTYANAEPRQGIEQRILNRTQAVAPAPASFALPHPFRQYWGWLATAAAAGALAAILIYPHLIYWHSRPSTVSLSQNSTTPTPATPMTSTTSAPDRAKHRLSLRHPAPSEPAVALIEPTAQEMLLAHFVSAHRSEALSSAKAQAALDQPIALRPLDLQPIQLQSISSEPIVIGPIQIDRLQSDYLHPASF